MANNDLDNTSIRANQTNNERRQRHFNSGRHCCGIECIEWLKLISSAGIPLMIAAITVLITIQQQNVAQKNREKDLINAQEQRKQDLEEARTRRAEDKEIAQQQREQDKDSSRLQRELDLKIANDKRELEEKIAEQQRIVTQEQRQHELDIAYKTRLNELALEDDRQKEAILIQYQRDLADVLLNHWDNLQGKRDMTRLAIQMRTRTALRLLNPERRTIVVRSLYDAHLLQIKFEEDESAFLAFANLSSVDFGQNKDSSVDDMWFFYSHLIVLGADMRNASFRNVYLASSFLGFNEANLNGVSWKHFTIDNVRFERVSMKQVMFQHGNIFKVDFFRIQLDFTLFEYTKITDNFTVTMSSMKWSNIRHSKMCRAEFTKTSITDSHFLNTTLLCVTFKENNMERMKFTDLILELVIFERVNLTNCIFGNISVNNVIFRNVTMRGCQGFHGTEWSSTHFISTTDPHGTLIQDSNSGKFFSELFARCSSIKCIE